MSSSGDSIPFTRDEIKEAFVEKNPDRGLGIKWDRLLGVISGATLLAVVSGWLDVIRGLAAGPAAFLGGLGDAGAREIRRITGVGEFAGTPGSVTDALGRVFGASFEGVPPELAYVAAVLATAAMLLILARLRIAILGRET